MADNSFSRRSALALLSGFGFYLPDSRASEEANVPMRLAISESLVEDVNINDARASMMIWLKQMMKDLKVVIEVNPQVFDTTQEIVRRARSGNVDALSLNILEYRQIVDVLDSSQVVLKGGSAGMDQYVLLTRRDSNFQQLASLRGRRLNILKAPKMCVASAWLTTILDEAHLGSNEQFFGPVTEEPKVALVVLPVFFRQADACLTTKGTFDTMCELNPQIERGLQTIAISASMVMGFEIFHKNYHNATRARFTGVMSNLMANVSGRQIATLFQFDGLTVRDGSCLATALSILEAADRVKSRHGSTVGRSQ